MFFIVLILNTSIQSKKGEALLVLFKGGSIEEAFKQAQSVSASDDSTARLQTVLDNIDQDHVAFVAENGKACALKQCVSLLQLNNF